MHGLSAKVVRRSRTKNVHVHVHVAPPPKSQFRGQGIHTVISLPDLRDASLENISEPIKLSFVMIICIHMGQNTIIRMIVP